MTGWRRSRRLERRASRIQADKGKGAASGSKGKRGERRERDRLLCSLRSPVGGQFNFYPPKNPPLPDSFSTDFSPLSFSSYLNGYLFWQQKIIVTKGEKKQTEMTCEVCASLSPRIQVRWEKHIIQHLSSMILSDSVFHTRNVLSPIFFSYVYHSRLASSSYENTMTRERRRRR